MFPLTIRKAGYRWGFLLLVCWRLAVIRHPAARHRPALAATSPSSRGLRPGVLATCGIRRPELAYEDTQLCLLFLVNFPEKV